MTAQDAKRALRRHARGLPAPTAEEAEAVRGGLLRFGLPRGVLLYLALPDEVDVEPLAAWLPAPVLVTRTPERGPLTIHRLDAPRERHPFGFAQPDPLAPEVADETVGAVLVPGLAFDLRGGRLGRGLGHYDRLLARLKGRIVVGVTLRRRLVDLVPADPHDVRMTHLATEDGVVPAMELTG